MAESTRTGGATTGGVWYKARVARPVDTAGGSLRRGVAVSVRREEDGEVWRVLGPAVAVTLDAAEFGRHVELTPDVRGRPTRDPDPDVRDEYWAALDSWDAAAWEWLADVPVVPAGCR